MSRYNHHTKLRKKDYVFRFLGSVIVISILLLCLPKDGYTTHHYSLGEPWEESPIIATDSFPVFKSEETLQREKDSLQRYYEPYFQIDPTVATSEIESLTEEFRSNLHGTIPQYYLRHLAQKLKEIYESGILTAEDYEKLKADNTRNVWVYNQNISSGRNIKNLYTEKSAYKAMTTDEDSVHYTHERLLHCNLSHFIVPNLTYDVEKSQQQREDVDNQLIPYMGQVQVGQKIVDRGQIVDDYTYNVLRSMERYQEGRQKSNTEKMFMIGGQAIFCIMIVMLLLFYFQQFRSDYLQKPRYVLFVLLHFLILPLCTYFLVVHHLMSVYVIPYCILPVFIRVFMDSRSAFITHILTLFACAIALKHPFEFMLVQSVAGLVAIYTLRELQERSDLFRAMAAVVCTTLLTYLCIDLIQGHFFTTDGIDRWTYIYIGIAGILSLISYLLLIPIEQLFHFTSNVTLVELSNINNTVLQRLSEEAPGTFQHSMQVANLAAEVANRIGAKSQLVRTGALYHDIGKLENAVFFTENQSGKNPHDELSYEQSAQIIIQHVQKGLRLADKYQLPRVIKDFIATHHGRSMTRYFYISYKNKYPDRPIDEKIFTYPGPNPFTQEQAILMMADAVEAASRSLSEYTEESISTLVDKIIDQQVQSGYFSQCPITFLDIQEAKEVFKSKLKIIYHTRIQYPDLKTGTK